MTPRIVEFGGCLPRVSATAFLAPGSVVVGNVEIGEEASVWYGAVLRGDHPRHVVGVGARANVQDNAVLHVSDQGPTLVGDEATVGHGAVLESCRIGRATVVGMNAVVLQRADVGAGCLVAAGALVKEGMVVPEDRLVAGVPGRVLPLSAAASAWVARSAAHYVALSRRYMATAEPRCELCGGQLVERRCKVMCTNCGFQRDCSDP